MEESQILFDSDLPFATRRAAELIESEILFDSDLPGARRAGDVDDDEDSFSDTGCEAAGVFMNVAPHPLSYYMPMVRVNCCS